MSIEKQVSEQNILAAQAEWEGLFHCPFLVIDNDESSALKSFDRGLKGKKLLQAVRSDFYGKK
jgi:hypothetical protein